MNTIDIFPEWASYIHTTYDEIMNESAEMLTNLVLSRNLVIIKGLSKNLSDKEFFLLGQKFGRVWTNEDYSKPYVSTSNNRTLNSKTTEYPVSYFKSNNNSFGSKYMHYHADMVHVKELSYPGRLLYLTQKETQGSANTSWLNLELGWSLLSEEEKKSYAGIEVVNHDMYLPRSRMEKFPFLKTNPKTGKVSPRVNIWYCGKKKDGSETLGWIHHLEKNGIPIGIKETGAIISSLYELLESKKNTVYSHEWQEGDIIVYDNWFNVHKRDAVNDVNLAENQVRLLKRLTFNFL